MKVKEAFQDGTTKKLYTTDNADQLVMEFLDEMVSEDGKKKAKVKDKGSISTEISSFFFEYLENYNVPTHYIKKIDDSSLVVKKLEMIPIRLDIWNVATADLAKRFGFKENSSLDSPVIELYLKDAKLKNPMINEYHAFALGLCDRTEMSNILRMAAKINAVLKSYLVRKKLALVNFSLEFGKAGNQILLGDALTPDTFVIWEINDDDSLNKDSLKVTSDKAASVYSKLKEKLL